MSVPASPTSPTARWRCLMLVYLTPGPHTVRGLAKVLGVSKPVVTRALNTLGALGYLRRERDQDDRRNVFVVRTSNGADFLEGFKRNLRESDRSRRLLTGQSSDSSPPSRTSADGFAISGPSNPPDPAVQRLSPGPGRRRARRASHRVPLCRADRTDADRERAAVVLRHPTMPRTLARTRRPDDAVRLLDDSSAAGPGATPAGPAVGYVRAEALGA